MENKKKSKWSFLANLDVIVASVILAILIILTFARGYLALCVSCTIYMVRGSSDILYGVDHICGSRCGIPER